MVKKMDDKKIAEAVAMAASGKTHQQIADHFNVSRQLITFLLSKSPDMAKYCQIKKEEQRMAMDDFLKNRLDKAQNIIDVILNTPADEIALAPLREKMGALKILTDIYSGNSAETNHNPVSVNISFEDTSKDGDKDM